VEKVKNLIFPPKDVYAKVLVEEAKIDQDVSQEVKAKKPVIEELSEDQPAPAKLQIVRSGKLKAKAATDDDHKFSVLIVEDDKVTRMVTQRILEKNDYMTTIAEDGIDALLQLGRADFDLILSDINMPNLDGFKLLEMMGQKGIACPVILMTGSTSDETEIRGFELGAFDYIKKPIQKDVLLKRIKNVLAKSSDKKFKTA